jgi:hypothetical protein
VYFVLATEAGVDQVMIEFDRSQIQLYEVVASNVAAINATCHRRRGCERSAAALMERNQPCSRCRDER